MQIISAAFLDGGDIPARYTCDGENISPELAWTGVPEGTVSLTLIHDDPDAPMGTWVHWVVFNIPASGQSFTRDVALGAGTEAGSLEGLTSFGKSEYGGPCPPSGVHRYYFKLYAVDIKLPLESGATKESVLAAQAGHVLAQAELMGRYGRR